VKLLLSNPQQDPPMLFSVGFRGGIHMAIK